LKGWGGRDGMGWGGWEGVHRSDHLQLC
jgi:hypothetical protein